MAAAVFNDMALWYYWAVPNTHTIPLVMNDSCLMWKNLKTKKTLWCMITGDIYLHDSLIYQKELIDSR